MTKLSGNKGKLQLTIKYGSYSIIQKRHTRSHTYTVYRLLNNCSQLQIAN